MVYSVSNSTMINFGLVCILPALFVFTALILTICCLKNHALSYRTKMSWQTFVQKKTNWKNELWFSQVTESEMQTTCDSAKTWLSRNSLELKSQQTACFSSLPFFQFYFSHWIQPCEKWIDMFKDRNRKISQTYDVLIPLAFKCGIVSGRIRDGFLSVLLDYDSVLAWFRFWLCYWRKPALKVQVACTYSSVWFWLNFLPN